MASDTDMDDCKRSFIDLFGRSARVRIIDTLVSMSHPDMNITDIADQSELARSTIYDEFDDLQSMGIVEETRVVGGSPMYTINESALETEFNRILKTSDNADDDNLAESTSGDN